MPATPHLAFPFRRNPDTGKVVAVQQDTDEHIQSCEASIANCNLGRRIDRPDFGWPFPTGKQIPVDPRPLIDALNKFEPRVKNRSVTEYQDLADLTGASRIIQEASQMPGGGNSVGD
jgi:phage baseplate assembly protein W